MHVEKHQDRYKRENDDIIIEIGVKDSRQLFNVHDPAPFRERDLDLQFVNYLVSAIEEFPLRTKMKIRILTAEPNDLKKDSILTIEEAIRTYFEYESKLAKSKLRNRHRTSRYFFLIGTITLFVCLTIAQFIKAIISAPALAEIISVGFVITGWVAMWHPIEALLYDWWPIREQRRYFDKISGLDVEIISSDETYR
ncbi:MAG: hypothetical protein H7235_03265 [Bdellovibrionaceae bacterium]|nr:hypothetical protein [Pseudobdellovibrionaceae bacterium]